jgi:hypothetical protein
MVARFCFSGGETMIKAPWNAEQVDNLNRFQRCGFLHSFTCPGHEGGGDRTLFATRKGWICPHCGYTQDWAHEIMVAFDEATQEKAREDYLYHGKP